jgi:hypothetical protein
MRDSSCRTRRSACRHSPLRAPGASLQGRDHSVPPPGASRCASRAIPVAVPAWPLSSGIRRAGGREDRYAAPVSRHTSAPRRSVGRAPCSDRQKSPKRCLVRAGVRARRGRLSLLCPPQVVHRSVEEYAFEGRAVSAFAVRVGACAQAPWSCSAYRCWLRRVERPFSGRGTDGGGRRCRPPPGAPVLRPSLGARAEVVMTR